VLFLEFRYELLFLMWFNFSKNLRHFPTFIDKRTILKWQYFFLEYTVELRIIIFRRKNKSTCGPSLRTVLWRGTNEVIFFNHNLKIRSHRESNPGPEECYSDHLPTRLEALSLIFRRRNGNKKSCSQSQSK
jgi:hypothetical protein